jgi:hypothetical protein
MATIPVGTPGIPNGQQDTVPEFLKFALEQLETRIALVDNKAVLLITTANAIAGAAVWAGYSLITTEAAVWLQVTAASLGVLILVVAALSTLYILGAIRPTKYLLGKQVSPNPLGEERGLLLWPPKEDVVTPAWYQNQLDKLDAVAEYRAKHFALLQLVTRKYERYTSAVHLIKLMSLVAILGIALLYGATIVYRLVAA